MLYKYGTGLPKSIAVIFKMCIMYIVYMYSIMHYICYAFIYFTLCGDIGITENIIYDLPPTEEHEKSSTKGPPKHNHDNSVREEEYGYYILE